MSCGIGVPQGMGGEDQDSSPGGELWQGMEEGSEETPVGCCRPGCAGGEEVIMEEDGKHS
jgi:hypothetical protein